MKKGFRRGFTAEIGEHRQGRVRFRGGWERNLVRDLDEEELLLDVAKERVRQNKPVGDVSIFREVDGHKIRFTQRQSRSRLLHVEKG